jgi:hypothetical protein
MIHTIQLSVIRRLVTIENWTNTHDYSMVNLNNANMHESPTSPGNKIQIPRVSKSPGNSAIFEAVNRSLSAVQNPGLVNYYAQETLRTHLFVCLFAD